MPIKSSILDKVGTIKKRVAAPRKEKLPLKPEEKPEHFFEALGRRKTSAARVRIMAKGDKTIFVNGKPFQSYFPTLELQEIVLSPLKLLNYLEQFGVTIKVNGGGIHSQAEAVRHGISRALVLLDADSRKKFKKAGYLTRDSRMRERKKFGLKRARRAPQWGKR